MTTSITRELITPPKSSNYNSLLPGVKAIAFIWICAFHSVLFYDIPVGTDFSKSVDEFKNNIIPDVLLAGTVAVEIFMILSGYLLGQDLWYQFVRFGRINPWQILKQRLIRLYPTFIFMEIIQTISFSALCPCISEIAFLHTGSYGCLPSVWSTIVDFHSWILIVPAFALICRWGNRLFVRTAAICFGSILIVLWVCFRFYQFWSNQYVLVVAGARHLPAHLMEHLQETHPNAPWHLTGNYRDPQLEWERSVSNIFNDTFYTNFFTKFGAVVAGFVLYLLLNPVKLESPSPSTPQPSTFQQLLFKFHLPFVVISVPIMFTLLTCHELPVSPSVVAWPKSVQMVYMTFYRPLFVGIFCGFLALLLSVPQQFERLPWNVFYRAIYNFLSLDIWFFVAKISYAGYYWNLPLCATTSIVIYPIDLDSGVPLSYQYFMATLIMFALLVPISVVTHLLVEQPAAKWLRAAIHSKPSRLMDNTKRS